MRQLRRLVHRVAATLAALISLSDPGSAAATGTNPVNAATSSADPFALGADVQGAVAPAQPHDAIFATIVVNHRKFARFVELRGATGDLQIRGEGALYAGLVQTADRNVFLPLKAIPEITFSYDALNNQLTVVKRRHSDGPNLIRFNQPPPATGPPRLSAEPLTALGIDYDLAATHAGGQNRIGGLFGARLSRSNLALDSGWKLGPDDDGGRTRLTRLDNAATVIFPRSMVRATAGDFISITSGSNRAVRMGGLQLATDFGLRPDLITYPLPDFVGSVAVPTGIDLLINDRRLSQEKVEPGEFTLRDIPVPTGRSGIGVVYRDALGREQSSTISFYSSRVMLRPGLAQAAFSIGAIRTGYATSADAYRGAAASGFVRYGLARSLTGEATIEAASGFANLGAGGSLTLGSFGVFTGRLNLSGSRQKNSGNRHGAMLSAEFESSGPFFSFHVEARRALGRYDDLASAKGDVPPPSSIAANISFDLAKCGLVNLAAVDQSSQRYLRPPLERQHTRVLSISYRAALTRRLNLFVDLSRRTSLNSPSATSLLLGLSFNLDPRTNIQASAYRQDRQTQADVAIYRPDREIGEVGYSLRANKGLIDQLRGGVSYRGSAGRVTGEVGMIAGQLNGQVSAQGSLMLAGGELFAHDNRGGSIVVVDSGGIPGIAIQRQNRLAGLTSQSGKLVISDIPALVPTKISIDPKSLPSDVSAANLEDVVSLTPRAAYRLRIAVKRYVPQLVKLLGAKQQALPAGTTVVGLPSRTEYLVGFDGFTEVNAILGDSRLALLDDPLADCEAPIPPKSTVAAFQTIDLHCIRRVNVAASSPRR